MAGVTVTVRLIHCCNPLRPQIINLVHCHRKSSLHLVSDVADFALNVDAKDVLVRVPHQSSRLPIKRNTVSRKLVGVQSGIEPIDQFFIGQLGEVGSWQPEIKHVG
jgi:hypothetical protein